MPPRNVTAHADCQHLSAQSSGLIVTWPSAFLFVLRREPAMGSMTFHAETKPAGVLMPYGRAVTSVRFSWPASFIAIHAYHRLPKQRATAMPGHERFQMRSWKATM